MILPVATRSPKTLPQPDDAAEVKLNGLLALYAAAKGPKTKYQTLLQVRRVFLAGTAAHGARMRRLHGACMGLAWPTFACMHACMHAVALAACTNTPMHIHHPPLPPRQVLRFAAANKTLAAQLAPTTRGRAHEWVQQWQLADKDAHELYMAAAGLLKVRVERVWSACGARV
jgi:hypothetical protein